MIKEIHNYAYFVVYLDDNDNIYGFSWSHCKLDECALLKL